MSCCEVACTGCPAFNSLEYCICEVAQQLHQQEHSITGVLFRFHLWDAQL